MSPKPNYKTAEHGYLYCLFNESQPHLVKIGMTANDKKPHQRAKEISSTTAIATPFRVEFAKQVRHPYRLEQELHRLLQTKGMRVNHKKEHFRMTPYEALHYFHAIEGEWDPPPSPYLMRPIRPTPVYGQRLVAPLHTPQTFRLSPPLSPIQPRMDEYATLESQESQESQEPGAAHAPYTIAPTTQSQSLALAHAIPHVSTCGILILVCGLCLIFYLVLSS